MARRPTRDVEAAKVRLQRAAEQEGLIAVRDFRYGGSIARDLLAVLQALRVLEAQADADDLYMTANGL
jgi:hypothetical protein